MEWKGKERLGKAMNTKYRNGLFNVWWILIYFCSYCKKIFYLKVLVFKFDVFAPAVTFPSKSSNE